MDRLRTAFTTDNGDGQVVRATSDAATTVVDLHGEIDLAVAELLRDRVLGAVEQGGDVLVDLSDVTLIDCISLGVLIQADDLADRRGTRFCLVAPSRTVRRTLAAAGLGGAFRTFRDRRQAFREIRSTPGREFPALGRRVSAPRTPRTASC